MNLLRRKKMSFINKSQTNKKKLKNKKKIINEK